MAERVTRRARFMIGVRHDVERRRDDTHSRDGCRAARSFFREVRPRLAAAPPPPQATCVFTNPAYSGKCVENADIAEGSSPQQACQAILSCLNNVECLKTYCSATTIRSGWTARVGEIGPGAPGVRMRPL